MDVIGKVYDDGKTRVTIKLNKQAEIFVATYRMSETMGCFFLNTASKAHNEDQAMEMFTKEVSRFTTVTRDDREEM